VRILNISAAGARFLLRPKLLPFPVSALRPESDLAISLSLDDGESDAPRSWLMIGRVRSLVAGEDATEMSVRFSLAGEKDVHSASGAPLRSIEEGGLEGLGKWIFERHLELYRQKG
jgi:hypothetical protein